MFRFITYAPNHNDPHYLPSYHKGVAGSVEVAPMQLLRWFSLQLSQRLSPLLYTQEPL